MALSFAELSDLERAGNWTQVRRELPQCLPALAGDDLARAYISLATAFDRTAETTAEYCTALSMSEKAVAAATPGGLMHVWALHLVAAYAADLGYDRAAGRAAEAFLALYGRHRRAQRVSPLVLAALGRVLTRQGRHFEAVALYRQALAAGASGELAERIQLMIARALGRAGAISRALRECPSETHYVPAGKIAAAQALIYGHAGDWPAAHAAARDALRSYTAGGWKVYDIAEVSELLLTLKQAAIAIGHYREGARWQRRMLLTVCAVNPRLLLLPVCAVRSDGSYSEAVSSNQGPSGHKRMGLVGAVG